MRCLLLLSALTLVTCVAAVPAQSEGDSGPADEKKLKDAYQASDGEALVELLRTRARASIEPKVLDELIEKLDSKDAAERNKAGGQLIAIGLPALAKLRVKARTPDADVVLAKRLVAVIEGEQANVTGAAVRLLAVRRPAGAARALIEFLPHAEDEIVDDVKVALAIVAYEKGKPDPALLAALEDAHPLRRGGAITALCAGGLAEPRATLRKMLSDKSPYVRFRASLALSRASDSKAVSTLISLLGDLPLVEGREAEAFLTDLAGEKSPPVPLGNDDVSKQKCRDAWAKWWLDSDGPALIKELEKRTLTEEVTNKANGLIEKLGSDNFDERQESEAELKKMGPRIVPLLKTAMTNADLEIRNRARKLLTVLGTESRTLSPVVPRLIALRKPRGAVEAILAYVPFAEEDLEEVQAALNVVTFATGKANPAVVKALADKLPARRAAAATALCAGPLEDHAADVRKLLDPKTEKDNGVRLRVALALANARDKEVVPRLIDLIGEMPGDQARPAEEYLLRLAREAPPKNLPSGVDDRSRKDRADAWHKWWDANHKTVVMVDRTPMEFRQPYQGLILLIQNANQIMEINKDGKTVMTMTGLNNPRDAHWIGKDRLLVAEYSTRKISERNLKGEILWEATVNFLIIQAERLRNGDTFVVGTKMLTQLDRNKKAVFNYQSPDVMRGARKLPNGEIAVITSRGTFVRLDSTGKELKKVQLANLSSYQSEILDNGNVLMPLGNNRVAEYTPEGKEVWALNTVNEQPMHAIRLPNKNTLVATAGNGYKITEYDPSGKKVREHVTNVYPYRIRAR